MTRSAAPAGTDFRVLVVDDEVLFARALARTIARHGVICEVAHTASEAVAQASRGRFDAVLLDHKLPDGDGIRLVPVLRARMPDAVMLVMTAFEAIPSAIQAIRLGAEDYLVKQASMDPLVSAVLEVRRRLELRSPEGEDAAGGLLGRSPGIRAARELLSRAGALPEMTVLLLGESGTGKEVAARWMHERHAPPGSPFVPVDCVAMPASLAESLLFGHEKGAFTGADRAATGAFEAAGEGTVFLDEIGDMDLALQGKLLRVLESREFTRVGSVRRLPVRARIVAATHRDLDQMVREGTFRFDLFQRLAVYPISLPPLRDRERDVLLLAEHFIEVTARRLGRVPEPLSPAVEEALLRYDFPGNVRELKHLLERALILGDSGRVELRHLPERLWSPAGDGSGAAFQGTGGRTGSQDRPVASPRAAGSLEEMERRAILEALDRARGVKAEAARQLGISRFRLLRRMARLGLRSADPEP